MEFYPLKLSYHIRNYYFGEDLIHGIKDNLPDGKISETWEISDYKDTSGTVLNGELKGKSLHDLIKDYPHEIVGKDWSGPHFPILAKFLDASHLLPIHLHADNQTAKEKYNEPNGKTEAWYILWAAQNATILVGIKDGFSRDDLFKAFKEQDYDKVMYRKPIKTGDTVYVPAGILHSFGPDTLIYEVQQTSDLGNDVMPKDLYGKVRSEEDWDWHINETLDELKTNFVPEANPGLITFDDGVEKKYCVASEWFGLEQWQFENPILVSKPNRFRIISNLANPIKIKYSAKEETLKKGESCIIPAAMSEYKLIPESKAKLLISYLPDLEKDIIEPLSHHGFTRQDIEALGDI